MDTYKENLDTAKIKRAGNRLQAFSQSEVYRKDIRPWVMERLGIARTRLYNPEIPEDRIEAVAIMGVLEVFLEKVEGISWEKRWQKQTNLDPETKRDGFLNRIKKKLTR